MELHVASSTLFRVVLLLSIVLCAAFDNEYQYSVNREALLKKDGEYAKNRLSLNQVSGPHER